MKGRFPGGCTCLIRMTHRDPMRTHGKSCKWNFTVQQHRHTVFTVLRMTEFPLMVNLFLSQKTHKYCDGPLSICHVLLHAREPQAQLNVTG